MNASRRNLLLGSAAAAAAVSTSGCNMIGTGTGTGTQILQPVIDAIQKVVATGCGWVPNVATLIAIVGQFPGLKGASSIADDLLKEVDAFLCRQFTGGGGAQAAIEFGNCPHSRTQRRAQGRHRSRSARLCVGRRQQEVRRFLNCLSVRHGEGMILQVALPTFPIHPGLEFPLLRRVIGPVAACTPIPRHPQAAAGPPFFAEPDHETSKPRRPAHVIHLAQILIFGDDGRLQRAAASLFFVSLCSDEIGGSDVWFHAQHAGGHARSFPRREGRRRTGPAASEKRG